MLHPPFRSTFDMTDIHIKTPPPPDIQQDNLLHLFHQEFLSGLPYGHKNNIRLLGCNIIKQANISSSVLIYPSLYPEIATPG